MNGDPQRETLTVCMIVMDEEERLPAALASVAAIADELVVVDSGSRDRTVELARAAGAKVVEHPWAGFSAQRNVALDHATGDWVLELDADERVTPALAAEIERFLAAPPSDVAIGVLPLSGWFLGRLLRPSMKYPHYRTRLFRRGAYRHDEARQVHEGLWPRGRAWVATGDLEHVLASTLREALGDWWRYARLEAAHAPPLAGASGALKAIALRPLTKLGYRLVVDGGWRDGPQGLLKVALDCASDAVVATRLLLRGRADGDGGAGHFAREEPAVGTVRLVAVASGPAEAARAVAWLHGAYAAGADAALITDAPPAPQPWLHVVPVPRVGPLQLMRAADVAIQIRPVDAFVPFGRRARRALRLLPTTLSGRVAPRDPDERPDDARAAVERAARPDDGASGAAGSGGSGDGDDAARSARLLFAGELADGSLDAAALSAASVRAAVRSRPVPPKPVRFAQLVRRKRGDYDHLRAVAEPLHAARRDVLGAAAEGPPRFLVRIDEFPHYRAWDVPDRYGTEGYRRFHAIMAEAGVPYLIAATPHVSRSPLDPRERAWRPLEDDEIETLRAVEREGATLALHGLDHRTRHDHPRRHSEFCGLRVAAAAARVDEALAELERAGISRPEVFVPPYNRFDAAHYPLLVERFPIVCGGPESIGTLGFHRSPLWRDGAIYLPSYAPLYGHAREVLPAAREMVARGQALWAPITLHWGWEADDGWDDLVALARAIAPAASSWEPLLEQARAGRAG